MELVKLSIDTSRTRPSATRKLESEFEFFASRHGGRARWATDQIRFEFIFGLRGRVLMTRAAFALIAVALAMSPALLGAQRQPARPTEVLPGPTTTWSLAVVGDAIITRRVAQFDNPADPRFQDMVKVIRGADAAMVNLEISLLRLSGFKGWPEVENDGNWELGPPEAAHDLKQLGFDLYNRANN